MMFLVMFFCGLLVGEACGRTGISLLWPVAGMLIVFVVTVLTEGAQP